MDLHKSYHRLGQKISVLAGVSFELEPGKSLAVVGASGVGKSTLLHCLGLLDIPDRGEIRINDQAIRFDSKDKLAQDRRRSIGFVFQFHYLMAELSAVENVAIPLLIQGVSQGESFERAKLWLSRVGLSHRLLHRPAELSGGEQQRVAIARALVHQPKVILADEPTGNLDPDTARQVFDVLKEECRKLNSILMMATHNMELARNLDAVKTLHRGILE